MTVKTAARIENKSFQCEFKQFDEDDEFFRFEGLASTFNNIDRCGDTILPGAFLESIKERIPSLVSQHEIKRPLGIFTDIFETEKGLFVRGKMPKGDSHVRDHVIPQMKIGSLRTMSIGFNIDEFESKENEQGTVLKKLTVWEISIVTIPMDPKAQIEGFKSMFNSLDKDSKDQVIDIIKSDSKDEKESKPKEKVEEKGAVPFKDLPFKLDSNGDIDFDIAWDSDAAIQRIREFTDSTESPSNRYRDAFLWFDADATDNFGSYKLPIADVVDGRLVAIPRGIFAAAGALSGARGGVDIPDNDRERVISNVNRYYDKMDRESPLQKSLNISFDGFKSMRDVDQFLISDHGFTNRKAKNLISTIKRIVRDEQRVRDEQATQLVTDNVKELNQNLKEFFKTK